MPDVFDGYSAWLGIAPNEQPPNYYRLLALKLYESSPEAITRAADLVSTFVSVHSFGQHEAVAKRIMADVATARETLLNERAKRAYDEALKSELSSGSSPSAASKSALRKATAVLQSGHAATMTMAHSPIRAAENPARSPSASGISSAKPAAKNATPTGSQIGKARVLGEYLMQERIGSGGMGKVFKAQHRRMQRTVAIKVLPPTVVNSAEAVRRFYREVHAAGRLIHPNIVAAFDAGEQAGLHYLVMEFVDGLDIATLLKQAGPMAPDVALDYLIQTSRGLAYAHGEGIVHRDIKPGNLLVDKKGVVKILDMGLARFGELEELASAAGEGLTTTGQIMGTVDYMSPEQAEDTHRVDERTDIYSLGCTAFRMLTNQLPYTGDTVMKKLLAHRTTEVPSARAIVPEVPARLDALIQRMMAKSPDDRPATMREVLAELEACRTAMKAGKPSAAAPSSKSAVAPSPTKMPQSLVDTHSTDKEITSVNLQREGEDRSNHDAELLELRAVRKRWLVIAGIALATLGMFFAAGVMIAHLLEG